MPDELLDSKALGQRLGVAAETVLRWHRRGFLPAVRVGKKTIRFSWPEVFRVIQQRQPAPPTRCDSCRRILKRAAIEHSEIAQAADGLTIRCPECRKGGAR